MRRLLLTLILALTTLNQAWAGDDPQKLAEETRTLWTTLLKINTATMNTPPEVKKILNKEVRVGGFIIINEAETGKVKEFMLTPVAKGCIHVPPPPPNYVIHVKMAPGKETKVPDGPILVKGKIDLNKRKEDQSLFSYEMIATQVDAFPVK